ncbi:hypothetical protein WA158_000495 [Blastocystis sp. Blastoise]
MSATGLTQQEIEENRKKLAERFGTAARTGGKGSQRRKPIVHKTNSGDDKKLAATLKRCGSQSLPGIQEVNFFNADGTITHFKAPKVAPACNTYAVSGRSETKNMLPDILSQLGSNIFNPENLKDIAPPAEAAAPAAEESVPELVENFEEVSKN